jgi:hypothetical protein
MLKIVVSFVIILIIIISLNKTKPRSFHVEEFSDNPQCPKCQWVCENNTTCAKDCQPLCKEPRCTVQCKPLSPAKCTAVCDPPKCKVVCPTGSNPCVNGNCPPCKTVCEKPKCRTKCCKPKAICINQCPPPDCQWKCDMPKNCPKPQCKLICDDQQQEDVTWNTNELFNRGD